MFLWGCVWERGCFLKYVELVLFTLYAFLLLLFH